MRHRIQEVTLDRLAFLINKRLDVGVGTFTNSPSHLDSPVDIAHTFLPLITYKNHPSTVTLERGSSEQASKRPFNSSDQVYPVGVPIYEKILYNIHSQNEKNNEKMNGNHTHERFWRQGPAIHAVLEL